jgi:hypothetical protein
MTTKMCSTCRVEKDLNEYASDRSSDDGKDHRCRPCHREYCRQWSINNRAHRKNYRVNQYAANPQHRIKSSMLNRLKNFIRRGTYTARTAELIGCTYQVMLDWVSFNFEEDMSFTNYGTLWNFDFVIPFAAFDLTNEDELRAAMHYSNIKPCIRDMNYRISSAILPFFIANQKIRFHALNRLRNLQI